MALQERTKQEQVAQALLVNSGAEATEVPLVIEDGDLERGLEILERSLDGSGSGA